MIIGLSGYIGSGKDTVCEIMQWLIAIDKTNNPLHKKALLEQGIGDRYSYEYHSSFENKKFAYKLKQMAALFLGVKVKRFEEREFKDSYLGPEWDVNGKPITVRQFLQRLGTEAVKYGLHQDAWVNALFIDYKPHRDPEYPGNWIITDCRFPNEAEAIKERNGIIIRINRYDPTPLEERHESETALLDWKFDNTIDNNGSITNLIDIVRSLLKYYKITENANMVAH